MSDFLEDKFKLIECCNSVEYTNNLNKNTIILKNIISDFQEPSIKLKIKVNRFLKNNIEIDKLLDNYREIDKLILVSLRYNCIDLKHKYCGETHENIFNMTTHDEQKLKEM